MPSADLPYAQSCSRFYVMSSSFGLHARVATAMLLFCCSVYPLSAGAQISGVELSSQKKLPAKQAPAAAAQKKAGPPPREKFTLAEQNAAIIPDIPDARFFADSETDFMRAVPATPGPWLALSSGGADGAFGAGIIIGLTETGKRPDFSMVTGVSTGALMAPFVFLGSKYDDRLR